MRVGLEVDLDSEVRVILPEEVRFLKEEKGQSYREWGLSRAQGRNRGFQAANIVGTKALGQE